MISAEYNGWTNYETWNVVMWLQNTEKYYFELKKVLDHVEKSRNAVAKSDRKEYYTKFNIYISWLICTARGNKSTPDNVAWRDKKIDVSQVNEAIIEFLEITNYEYNKNERAKHE